MFGKYGDVLVIFRLSVDVWLFHVFFGLFFLLLLEALECLSHFILGKKLRKDISVGVFVKHVFNKGKSLPKIDLEESSFNLLHDK